MKSLISVTALVIILVFPCITFAGDNSWEYKEWTVASIDGLVKFTTHGTTVFGHEFGFVKKVSECEEDLFWISWSSYNPDIEEAIANGGTISLDVDGTSIHLEMYCGPTYQLTESLTLFSFTGRSVKEKLVALLEQGKEVRISIGAPVALLNLLDVTSDAFSLEGYTAARLKAQEFCENLSLAPDDDPFDNMKAALKAANAGDFETARELWGKEALKGNREAQYHLGFMYLHGGSDEPDKRKTAKWAVNWFRHAAMNGHIEAQRNLGDIYNKGNGVEQDLVEASMWYGLAAEQGDPTAQYYMGYMYANGLGVTEDHDEAIKWYRFAAEQGVAEAQYELSMELSLAFSTGEHKLTKEAVTWLRKAAEQGKALAQVNLGHAYLGGNGVVQSDGNAVMWYRMAAEQGNVYAQYSLGCMYADGRGVQQNDKEALKWILLAGEGGLDSAQLRLGAMYADGQGVQQNDKEALKWDRMAAEQGNLMALFRLGRRYDDGRGVLKSYEEAFAWYTVAVENGAYFARNNLSVLQKRMNTDQIKKGQQLAKQITKQILENISN